MHFYRNPFGAILAVRRDEDRKMFDELTELHGKGGYETYHPFLEILAEYGLCPYLDQEGMLSPSIKCDNEKEIINVIIPSNAMVLEHGQEEAENIFIHSMKENNARFLTCDGDEFYRDYKECIEAYEDMLRAEMFKKKEKKTIEKARMVPDKSSKKSIVYKLSDKRDIFKYKDAATHIFIFAGDYYIEAKEGVMLDDFLERATVDATKGKVIKI